VRVTFIAQTYRARDTTRRQTERGEPFAALVGTSGWLPLDNWVWDVAYGDDSRLLDDEDQFHDIEAFWEKDHEDDEDFN
jgi:hypothetical protein